jgi:hypothetical protein
MKLMKQIMRNSIAIILLFFSFSLAGQQYRFTAPLTPVNSSGYYRIAIRPEIAGRCHENFRDLRIRNTQGGDLPYFIDRPEETKTLDNFESLPIIKQWKTKTNSVYIVDRNDAKDKSSLVLRMANANVTKQMVVEGSDNLGVWYIVQAGLSLNPSLLRGTDVRETALDLPETRYRYLRFGFNDSLSGPIRVLDFGYYASQQIENKAFETPAPVLSFPNNNKNMVRILFNQPYSIDRIALDIAYKGYYYRECTVNFPSSKTGSTGGFVGGGALASYFKLNEIQLFAGNYQELWIDIENNDNPPLTIKAVHAWQKPIYAIANLEAGKTYALYYGNDSVQAPVYDLSHFKDRLRGSLPLCVAGKPLVINIANPETKYSFWHSQLFLWLGIGTVLVLLALFSLKMIKEMGANK